MEKIRWGIIGCGRIAGKFVRGLKMIPGAELAAVAARRPGGAEQFVAEFGAPRFYENYGELAADPDIDVVYVATTHNLHYENTMLCLRHGKHVLCEKAFTVNAAQAAEMIDLARAKELFLMEAMWTRFIPGTEKVNELLNDGTIGEVLSLKADFCFRAENQSLEGRLHNRHLAGGALLDLGIYPISLAYMIFKQPPLRIESNASLGPTGVDRFSSFLFEYENGREALMSASFVYAAPFEAVISGTGGYLRIPCFSNPQEITLHRNGKEAERFSIPYGEHGLRFETAHVMECLRAGKTESTVMPLDESLQIMKTMDQLRAQWGLIYPEEEK